MLEPESPASRRAAREERRRRRRFTVSLVAVSLSLCGIVAVVAVVALAHGSKHHRRLAAATVHHRRVPAGTGLTAIEAAGNANIRRLIPLGLPVYCGGPHGNEVAFTFDDGPGVYTHFAVKKLTEAHERATFFVVGRSMDGWPGWLPKEVNLGAIGDHTYTHPLLTALSPSAITSEIERTKEKAESTIGQSIYLFRPPYGARGPTVDATARQLGLLEVMWSVDSRDSLGADWLGIIHNVEAGLYPGAIILMHENRGQTIRALTTLLPELKRRHLRSVSLPELFANDPPSVEQVRAGGAGCAGPARSTLTGG